jgi:ankyrin repeat protein
MALAHNISMQERKPLPGDAPKMRTKRSIQEPAPTEKPKLSEDDQKWFNKKLLEAATWGKTYEIQRLLEKGVDINARDEILGRTALMWAAMGGHTKACKLLVEKGAKIDEEDDNEGMNPLMYAALTSRTDICAFLLEKGADLETRVTKQTSEYYGMTAPMIAEMIAAKLGHTRIVPFLRYMKSMHKQFGSEGLKKFFLDFRECLS